LCHVIIGFFVPCTYLEIYLGTKVVLFVLFCFSCWNLINHNMPLVTFFFISLESSWWMNEYLGALSWFHNVLTCVGEVIEYWIFFRWILKKINDKFFIRKNWTYPCWYCLKKTFWWIRFNKDDLQIFLDLQYEKY